MLKSVAIKWTWMLSREWRRV